MLHLTPSLFQEWHPHFFVLTPTKLHYTDETSALQTNEEEDDDGADNTVALEASP